MPMWRKLYFLAADPCHAFCAWVKTLVPWWDKCWYISGDYKEVWCVLYVSSATHVSCMHQIQNMVVGLSVFDFIFWNLFVIIVAF